MDTETYDVAIIGGGPAGSTAAALLARAGRRVIVLERDKFPRFHIGESLLPFSMRAFSRLGLLEKFARAGFMEKFGGEMYGACGDEGVKFYFEDGFRSQTDRSYQVTRADFDKLLLDHAAESGAEVREETNLDRIDFSDEDATLFISRKGNGTREELHARYVIDASGRNSILSAKFQLKKNYEHLQKVSVFAHYDGMTRAEGRDGTLTRMVRAIDRWFWVIPLSATRTSVGVVLDGAVYKQSGLGPEDFLAQAIEEQPLLMATMRDAKRVTPVRTAAEFSYRCTRLTGDRWLLAGDAAGFIDPVFSSGVFLAVLAGEQAADALHVVLDKPAKRRKLFANYERHINKAMDVYLRFVDAWYSKEFIEVFLHPQDLFQIPPAVNAVLGGNVGDCFAIKWRMWIFYLLVRLQKYIPLCPRRTLVPKRGSTGGGATGRSVGGGVLKSRILQFILVAALALSVSSCGTIHQFIGPSRDWQARNGQLLYRGKKTKLIGEVLVRFSKTGDFELTFTKGPGVTLLEIRQDANFFSVKGPLAGVSWSGTTEHAPPRLRGWLQLRDKLIALGDKPSLTHTYHGETFTFQF